jgi:hypothetical protein
LYAVQIKTYMQYITLQNLRGGCVWIGIGF